MGTLTEEAALAIFFSSPVRSTRRAIALPPALASALALVSAFASLSVLTKMLKFYVKVFKTFLRPDIF